MIRIVRIDPYGVKIYHCRTASALERLAAVFGIHQPAANPESIFVIRVYPDLAVIKRSAVI